MPFIRDWSKKGAIACVAVAGALLGCSQPALAASCTSQGQTSSVFAPFGDTSQYFLVPGGDFERSTPGWTLSKAKLVAGNEPWYVHSASDAQSLSLTSGGSAKSPMECITTDRPWWRFFAMDQNGSKASTLSVWAQWTNPDGTVGKTPTVSLNGSSYRSWEPTPQLTLGSFLSSTSITSVNATLMFTTTGNWQIDDIYVDPYAK